MSDVAAPFDAKSYTGPTSHFDAYSDGYQKGYERCREETAESSDWTLVRREELEALRAALKEALGQWQSWEESVSGEGVGRTYGRTKRKEYAMLLSRLSEGTSEPNDGD